MKKDNFWKYYNHNKLLIAGVILILGSIYISFDQFAIKSRLKRIDGTIRNANTYIETITGRRGNKSQKSELVFYMKEHQKKFYLSRNIGKNYYDKKYEALQKKLLNSDSVTVWVRSWELDNYEPKVFQISSRNSIILDYNDIRTEKSSVGIYILFLGMGLMIYFFKRKYPDKWHEIFYHKNGK